VQTVSRAQTLNSVVQGVIIVFAGLLAVVLTGSLFMLVFVPIVVYYLWRLNDKNRELERRVAALEKPPEKTAAPPP
jgi:hypothetical protein